MHFLLSLLIQTFGTPPLQGQLNLELPPDSAQIAQIADSLVLTWQKEGHLLAKVELSAEGRQLAWKIQPGPTLQWRQILSIQDSIFTQPVLQRISGIRQGSPTRPVDLELAQERITATGCADILSSPMIRGQRGTTWADAWLSLERVPCSHAQAALGWDSKLGFQGTVDVQLNNLLGTARSSVLAASAQGQTRSFDLGWHEPWLGSWDIALDSRLELQETQEHQLRRASSQGLFPAGRGLWIAGFELWSDQSGPADSTREVSALGTTLGWKWASPKRVDWLRPGKSATLLFTSLQTQGTDQPWLLRSGGKIAWNWELTRHFCLNGRMDAQGLFPLDSLTAMAESRPIGGSSNWKGHQEGQFQTAQWALGELELRAGLGGWGAALFVSPGAVWLWRSHGPRAYPGFGCGMGLHWTQENREIRLDMAGGEDTRSWQDTYLHLTLQSQF